MGCELHKSFYFVQYLCTGESVNVRMRDAQCRWLLRTTLGEEKNVFSRCGIWSLEGGKGQMAETNVFVQVITDIVV